MRTPMRCQWRAMGSISSDRSRNVQPVNSPVCVLSTAVGMQAHSTPVAEMTGSATVSEHLPSPDRSWTAAMRLSGGNVLSIE